MRDDHGAANGRPGVTAVAGQREELVDDGVAVASSDADDRVGAGPDIDDDDAVEVVEKYEVGDVLAEPRAGVDGPSVVEECKVACDIERVGVERVEEFVEMFE
jgi:hypothetical protein